MRRPTDVAGKSASQEKLSTDRGALREIAREILDKHSQCSESTQAEYRRVIQRMAGQHWHDYAVKHGLKTVLTVRAAWRVWAARQIIALLGESERGANAEERARARRHARGFAEQLLESREYCRPTSKSHQKKSKRGSLYGLPMDWRERLRDEIAQKHRFHYEIMAVTGCRPEELRRGFRLRALANNILEVTLQGAKTSGLTQGGQAWRTMCFRGGMARSICELVKSHGGVLVPPLVVGLGLQKAISAASKRLGYKNVSAYSLRHAFSADLKERGVHGDLVSLALGHVSRASKSHYGTARQGRGARSVLVSVEAHSPVRGEVRDPAVIFSQGATHAYDAAVGECGTDLIVDEQDPLEPR